MMVTGVLVSAQILFLACGCGSGVTPSGESTSRSGDLDIVPTVYPADTVKTIAGLGLEEGTYIRSRRGSASYTGNSGHDEPTLVVSPYYSLTINGTEIPVYATIVYVGADSECALHSFAIVDVKSAENMRLDVRLKAERYDLRKAAILPASLKTAASVEGDTVSASITGYGDYSFILNDEDSDESQYNSFTLFVREYADEDAQIAAYKAEYGEENVTVYDAGTHLFDYINVEKSNSVIYLRRGALLIARGNPEYGENTPYSEPGATSANGWGLDRYPIITINQKVNVTIAGSGAIDAGQLGWHERRGILATNCSNLDISGLTLINFPEWTLAVYQTSDVTIRDIRVFGYKTNCDGVAVCNSINVTVDDFYARSGDDLFEVKTLGGLPDAVTKNVTFTNCIAWAGKARCFGITAEVNRDISDVLYQDCAVIYRDSTWDNRILGSLVVISSEGKGSVTNVTFENIEIHKDYGRAINISVTGENQRQTIIENIVFRNITYQADLPNRFSTGDTGSNAISAVFENVTGNGVLLTQDTGAGQNETDSRSVLAYRNGTSESSDTLSD